jgi:hypothetical protein
VLSARSLVSEIGGSVGYLGSDVHQTRPAMTAGNITVPTGTPRSPAAAVEAAENDR